MVRPSPTSKRIQRGELDAKETIDTQDAYRPTGVSAPSWLAALVAPLIVLGCSASSESAAHLDNAIVYGSDDRKEYFEVTDPAARALMSESLVAIVPRAWITNTPAGPLLTAPSWGDAGGLCPDEPFADEPAAALCSGVLLDWDLVLTAGHCLRQLALDDLAVVFHYHYDSPGELAFSNADVVEPLEILSEKLDPAGNVPRLDYAWLRLKTPVSPRREPASVRVTARPMEVGAPIISVSTGGGTPMKLDSGGRVRDPRSASLDYFIADTDTVKGSSGGAAFDEELALAGILVRGAPDLVSTDEGCQVTRHEADGQLAAEQFTYAAAAVAELCSEDESASSLCRGDCGDPCTAMPPVVPTRSPVTASGGCQTNGAPHHCASNLPGGLIVGLLCFFLRPLLSDRRSGRESDGPRG